VFTLNKAKFNIPLRIRSVVKGDLSSKLTDMGLTPGQCIKILYKAPLGDPLAVEVGDYVLSLRVSEAMLIEIDQEI
jgi:Fe2+ transport system protein FeoA